MVATRQVPVRDGDVLLLVGTAQGLFLLRSAGSQRTTWEAGGPHFPGFDVRAAAFDSRGGRRRLWAGARRRAGAFLSSSDDFGRTWTPPDALSLRFPPGAGGPPMRIWQIRPGRGDEPDTLYCGVAPAGLFESRDGGATWSLVQGLHEHPHRPRWGRGGGLHTILPDPADRRRLYVGISRGGVYRTDDGGRIWHACNRGIRADFLPEKHAESGHCVHKLVLHPARPGRLFLQNHGGIYLSEDFGESWQDIGRGLPSDFGFPMAIHPRDPDTVYVLPLESDLFRCTPGGRLRVYRTRNAGRSWQPLTEGLPQKNALETVFRDAMTTDTLAPAGIYFGTRSGRVYASRNEGSSWKMILGGLPPVVCVKAAAVGEARKPRRRSSSGHGSAARPARKGRRP
jgi:hypothetical protein